MNAWHGHLAQHVRRQRTQGHLGARGGMALGHAQMRAHMTALRQGSARADGRCARTRLADGHARGQTARASIIRTECATLAHEGRTARTGRAHDGRTQALVEAGAETCSENLGGMSEGPTGRLVRPGPSLAKLSHVVGGWCAHDRVQRHMAMTVSD